MKCIGLYFGFIGVICLNFLFLFVFWGFVFFWVVDILFEYVVKYYMWLGYFMMILFIFYGFFYIIVWYFEDCLIKVCFNNSFFFRYLFI